VLPPPVPPPVPRPSPPGHPWGPDPIPSCAACPDRAPPGAGGKGHALARAPARWHGV